MRKSISEEWKPVDGYEKYYEISNIGRLRNKITNHILSPSVSKCGYYHIQLCYVGKKDYLIHRLVAKAFVENPNNYDIVNHKDENKKNNCSSNLEWCDQKYNANYGIRYFSRFSPVIQFDMNNKHIKSWSSMKEASEALGIYYQGISSCCRGVHKSCGGYKWSYQ